MKVGIAIHIVAGVFLFAAHSVWGLVSLCVLSLGWIVWYVIVDVGKSYEQPTITRSDNDTIDP